VAGLWGLATRNYLKQLNKLARKRAGQESYVRAILRLIVLGRTNKRSALEFAREVSNGDCSA
jgi:hypothetical protein